MPEIATPPRELDLGALQQAGERLWRELAPGSVLWLSGELGAGKTTLVQAIATAAGAGQARSPSFALVHEYPSPSGALVHADCYRLRRPDEAQDLDLLALARASRLMIIEWPERAGAYAPRPDRHLRLSHAPNPERRFLEVLA